MLTVKEHFHYKILRLYKSICHWLANVGKTMNISLLHFLSSWQVAFKLWLIKILLHYIVCILSLLKVHTSCIFLRKKLYRNEVQVRSSSASTGSSQVRFSLTWNFKSGQVWTFSSFLDTTINHIWAVFHLLVLSVVNLVYSWQLVTKQPTSLFITSRL